MKKIFETSLGRIWQHVDNAKNKSFAMITSWRQEKTQEENKADFNKLKQILQLAGHGFVTVLGHWRECQDQTIPYSKCPPEKLIDATEPSLFVIGIPKEFAISLANKYDQDAIVFAGPETEGQVVLFFKDGSQETIGDFRPQTMNQAFTELLRNKQSNARHFTFTECSTNEYIKTLIEEELKKI